MTNKYCKKETEKMKNVVDIRDEFFDNGNKISAQSMQDLIWHIENDPLPDRAISLVTDGYLTNRSFEELLYLIAKHLDHEDDFVRELTVGCVVGRIGLAAYAEKALNMAQEDPNSGPRGLATLSLGAVINKVDPTLKKQIAIYLYDVIINPEYDDLDKRSAFDSILKAMNIPTSQRIATSYDENHAIVKLFKVKYDV